MKLSMNALLRFLAGAVFGLYMAHLLFFLNPQLEVSPTRLARFGGAYALLCGAIFGSMLWAVGRLTSRWSEGKEPRGFGFTVAATFIATIVYWGHLVLFRIYLPRGAIRILSKATSILAATAFVLFILWIVERTAPRRVGRTIGVLGLLTVLSSSFFLYQRREGYRADRRVPVVANVGPIAGESRIVVVAIRNLPHDWIVRMKGEGSLPFLSKLTDEAFFTRLEPFRTTSPKALWASLATGKLPYRHGVTGRFSYETALNRADARFLIVPSWVGFRAWGLIPPVKRISAQLPAGDAFPFWRIVHRLGVGAAVVNWPSSSAEPHASVVVSDRYFRRGGSAADLFPREFAATAESFRAHAAAPGVPVEGGSNLRRTLRDAMQADRGAAAAARHLASQKVNLLTTVSLNGLEEAQRALAVENDLPGSSSLAGEIMRAYVSDIDRLIREVAEADREATLIVVSPVGPAAPPLPASPVAAIESLLLIDDPGRDDGFLAIRGPGAMHRDNPTAAEVVDVVPTLLFAAGLPISRDMDGRLLTEAFREEFLRSHPLSLIQTYESERLIIRRVDATAHRVTHEPTPRS